MAKKSTKTMNLSIRSHLIIFLLALMCFGWFSGGREPIMYFANSGILLIIAVLLVRSDAVRELRFPKSLVPLLAFVGCLGLSSVWSVNRYNSLVQLLVYAQASTLGFMAIQVLRDKAAREQWVKDWLGLAVFMTLIGMIFFLTGDYNRMIALFYWPNPLAAFLLPAILFALYLAKSAVEKKWRTVYCLSAIVVSTGFALTYSRGAWLVGVLALAIVVWRWRKETRFWLIFGIVLVGSAVLVGGLSFVRTHYAHKNSLPITQRLTENEQTGNLSVKDRLSYWSGAAKIFVDYPLHGVGAGNFSTIYPSYQSRVTAAGTDVHNVYLQFLAEMGIFGLLLVIGIGAIVLDFVRRKKRAELDWVVAIAALGLALHAGIDMDLRYPTLVFLLFVLLGMLVIESPRFWRVDGRRWRMVFLGLAIPLVLVGYSYLQSNTLANRAQQASEDGDTETALAEYTQSTRQILTNPDNYTKAGIESYKLAVTNPEKRSAYLADAKKFAETAMRKDRYDAQHYFLLANINKLADDEASADKYYGLAIAHDPLNNPQYYSVYADILITQKRLDEAQKLVDIVIANYPDDVLENRSYVVDLKARVASVYNQAAFLAIQRANFGQATDLLAHSLKLAPNNFGALELQKSLP